MGVEAKIVDHGDIEFGTELTSLDVASSGDASDDALHGLVKRSVAKTNEILIDVAVVHIGEPCDPWVDGCICAHDDTEQFVKNVRRNALNS